MGQCIIKDCGFDYQKSSASQNKKLRTFLAERIRERNNLRYEDLREEQIFDYSEKNVFTEKTSKKKINEYLRDIKEEEDGCEEEEFSNRMKEIQDLKILQEELKKIEKKASQFKERKNQSKAEIFQKENSHEDFKRSSNEKTKKIYNNLRYFDANETQFTNKSPIPDKKENVKPLLSSLTTIISKPNITSTNSINLECFMNENFKKDSQLNENDSFEEREKYAKIFSEEDYSDK